MINPNEDGVTHINIYTKGQTQLGRWLTNLAKEPIQTVDGYFRTVEGYWYWLSIHPSFRSSCDELRTSDGFEAKETGTIYRDQYGKYVDPYFEQKIKDALYLKLAANGEMRRLLWQSYPLPLEHYYVYGTLVRNAGHKWLLEIWTEFRNKLVKAWGNPND